ncbi:MAG: PAS domain S-box protein [Polyangiaceae bacterium]
MREDDERLLQAIRVGNIGIFDHDHRGGPLYWSLELRKMYGWAADDVVTLPNILSHVHPKDASRVGNALCRAHDPGGDGLFDIEHRIIDRAGQQRWLLTRSQTYFETVHGQRGPRRTIGAVQDVTDRRTADERLHVLDTVLTSSAQAMAIADAGGTLTFANAALYRLWGYPDSETLLGRSLFEFWTSPDAPELTLNRIRDCRVHYVETSAVRADGSAFHLGITAEAIAGATGELTPVLVSFTDISERKHLEAQLTQAQKMESIGRLAGGVAHDFNNLLTVISGGIELGLAMLGPDEPSCRHLMDAAEAARSAATLTRQLLAFSRKSAIAPRSLDLNALLGRIENMVVRLLGEGIQLKTSYGDAVTPVRFDPGQVEQIILNLAVNARDAMASGGRLTIATSTVCVTADAGEPTVTPRPGKYALLTVSDDGVGMSDDVRAHLFEPFFTTKEVGRGTGLGLAMVYGAVQQNGGSIEVESELGRGATFKVYFPAANAAPTTPPKRTPSPAPFARVASILLVEDDARVGAFAKTVLQQLGHKVHYLPNGDEALAALTSLQPVPELLITDVVMLGINGRVLAEALAAVLPGIPVLFVSGYTQDVIAEPANASERTAFLPKPYSAEALARRVRQLLEKAATPGVTCHKSS